MKIVKFEATLEVRDNAIDELKKVEHHAEYLLDLDRWPEIISVSGVKLQEVCDDRQ